VIVGDNRQERPDIGACQVILESVPNRPPHRGTDIIEAKQELTSHAGDQRVGESCAPRRTPIQCLSALGQRNVGSFDGTGLVPTVVSLLSTWESLVRYAG